MEFYNTNRAISIRCVLETAKKQIQNDLNYLVLYKTNRSFFSLPN